MSLIGIIASSKLGKEVTGGTLASDATFYYRTFTGNGTLGVKGFTLTADILVVAGGGGGGYPNTAGGGGGGAGGSCGGNRDRGLRDRAHRALRGLVPRRLPRLPGGEVAAP